jgi:hypothetical protein
MIHPNLTGRRRARVPNQAHGPRTVTFMIQLGARTGQLSCKYGIFWDDRHTLGSEDVASQQWCYVALIITSILNRKFPLPPLFPLAIPSKEWLI